MLSITWHSKSKYIYFGGEKGNDLLERIQSFLKQNEKVSDNGGIDESQLQKALESLLSDDSDDASIADDTSQNLPSRPKEIGAGKNFRNQHGKHGETASNSKTSKYEIEESIIESTSRINNIRKESVNLHTPPIPDNTTCTGNLHTPPKPNNTELIKKTKKHNPLGNLSSGHENNIEIDLLKSKLDRFAENVSATLDDLSFEINHIKENKPYSIVILEDVINDLKKEKLELRKINDDHQERIIDMSRTISDLKLINKNLEEEKSSLLTTIRLIQSDYSQSSTKLREREVEKEKPATWKVSKQSTRSKVSFSQAGENTLKQATSTQYLVDLIPMHSSYRCHLNYMALSKINVQDNSTQL